MSEYLYVAGERFLACTNTEVLIFSLPNFELESTISLPFFNDLHHVTFSDSGNLLVVVTGLDMVVEISLDGKVEREWSVNSTPLWTKFSRKIDYRKIPTTKPHASHPNYVFHYKDELWVTRFIEEDAICLTDKDRRINIGVGSPHDGCVHGDTCYFTTVNGCIVIADLKHLKAKILNIGDMLGQSEPLGWCRGLKILEGNRVILGFSRLRHTTARQNIEWVKKKLVAIKGVADKIWLAPPPTRLMCIDLNTQELIWEQNLEDHDMHVVSSIH